jgi:hypothetical protein
MKMSRISLCSEFLTIYFVPSTSLRRYSRYETISFIIHVCLITEGMLIEFVEFLTLW